MADVSFEIKEELGVLSTSKWNLELNVVSWNNGAAKYDIRSWSPDRSKMGKGITLTKEELSALKNILNNIDEI